MKLTLKSLMAPRGGAFPMAAGSFALGLGLFAALLVLVATFGLWRLLAPRAGRVAWLVPVVGALLLVGCFLPAPRERDVSALEGTAEGGAWIPVAAGPDATVEATDGAARLERLPNGTFLVLECPASCALRGGTTEDAPARSLAAGDPALASGQGALRLTHLKTRCTRLPVVVALSFQPTCVRCAADVYELAADGRLHGAPSGAC